MSWLAIAALGADYILGLYLMLIVIGLAFVVIVSPVVSRKSTVEMVDGETLPIPCRNPEPYIPPLPPRVCFVRDVYRPRLRKRDRERRGQSDDRHAGKIGGRVGR
jgi:hypothetical protein